MDNVKKEKIAIEVIRTLAGRFDSFPENSDSNRNAPFHKAFLNAFKDNFKELEKGTPYFISLSSWLHGLNTTLGQSFFEKVAHILSDGEKRSFTGDDRLPISKYQTETISDIITDLKNKEKTPSLVDENDLIFQKYQNSDGKPVDFTADVFYQIDNKVVCIELKSVKPNAGEIRGEKRKILEGKASLCKLYKDKDIKFYFGFPFDPTGESDYDYDVQRFLNHVIDGNKYLDREEVLLGPALWDYLSGEENTMQELISIINDIAKPDFKKKLRKLNEDVLYLNFENDEYDRLLKQWHLYREAQFRNEKNVKKVQSSTNTKIRKKFNQQRFKTGSTNYGEYNESRIHELLDFID
ncbi:TdeIII family type II restriction endonuclease [Rhodohalobacter barkolensis]|uniref:type II site-specific deoxyribonuclease n=1 Tax=Rhodohalobacter barkolensis TaxID=2053187 RepID=A0A2N0VHS7_9BACT|nr:TdeIII family type II restriction endonuclease [Rhodohalobacter barkolensis]PKD43742.1 TdeIII family type II restriction endonuclease [Rhodohalobacter barkolensis]